ncbi:MAG: DNA polymerase/3'-5' exonuclease PolX [Candidatus Omnitrophota bacterium]
MDNKQIANIFLRIADILEIKGENIFKVRAYRTAAQNISGLPRQLKDIFEEDPEKLGNIPGIGKDLKARIMEMIGTGRLGYYDEIVKEFPAGFFDMLNISGLGPKKIKKLHEELGINNVDDLEKACREGRLENVEGMGSRTEEKFLEAIKHFRKAEGRMLLGEANRTADEVVGYLSSSGCFKKIEKAGSLRRGRETVGDLDILAVAKDSARAMDHFVNYPEVETVIAKGSTKASVSLKDGPQVDLRIVDSSCFGAALVYFTGSQSHNVKIRQLAKDMGYKVSEYGVFTVSKTSGKEKMAAGETEEEVYAKLGMQWVPPELREDRGEIEAALKGLLPGRLLEIKDIIGDLHIHTSETDGSSALEDVVEAARKKGYKYIAITDHSKLIRIAHGMDEKRLLKHAEKIRKLDAKTKGIKVLAGVEVDILTDGSLDLEDRALKELDIVIAAVHSAFTLERDKQTARILKAMDNKYVNILAHPSGRLITSRTGLDMDLDRVFRKAAENNVFLEINTHGERIDLNDVNSRRAKELGVSFAINTDAHDITQLDLMMYGVITARRGWLEKKDVLNTLPLDKMLKALKR